MNTKEFKDIKTQFISANVEQKIRIYTTVEGLTQSQYKQLLKEFPVEHLDQLERALE